jgi:predicted PurR-regulated permease PerM
VQEFLERYVDEPETLIGPLTSIGLSVVGVLGALVFMLLTAYFIALRPQPLIDGLLALFPPQRRPAVLHLTRRLRDAWIGWLQGVVVDMLVTGVLLYIGLTVIGLDFAIFFAVFSALLVVIPYFGAIIGAVPVVLFALAESPGTAVAAFVVYLLVQQVESNIIIPIVMAQRVKLHPALIAIGVVLVGQLFGFVGLFVAVPIISGFVILVDELWVRPLEVKGEVDAAMEAQVPEILSTGGA